MYEAGDMVMGASELLPCPFCGATMKDWHGMSFAHPLVDSRADSCILAGLSFSYTHSRWGTDEKMRWNRRANANAERDAAFALGVEVSHYVARTSTGKIASEIDDLRPMTPLQAALALPEVRELVAALNSIARNTCCEGCQEAALVARTTLAKLEAKA